jgi:hypothetical protein
LVRQVGLIADNCDQTVVPMLRETDRELPSGMACADDDDSVSQNLSP